MINRFIQTTAWAIVLFSQPAMAAENFVNLTLGKHTIQAELALTPTEKKRGLMFRQALPQNHGMIFSYAAPQQICMWMKNTVIPLAVAFIDSDGRIINIAHMEPLNLKAHCSNSPASYALEMNQGWFKRNGIKSKAQVGQLDQLNQ